MIAGSAIEKAEKIVSPSAQLMQDFGPMFAIFQAQLGKLAVSFQPFFVGMASSVIPQLMVVVEEIQKIDLTAVGQSFGDAIASAVVMLKDGVTFVQETLKKSSDIIEKLTPSGLNTKNATGAAFMGAGGIGGGVGAAEFKKQIAAAPEVAPPINEGFIGPMLPTTTERAQQIKDEMLKQYAPKPIDTGIDFATMGPKARAEAGAITTSLGKVGGGGNVFGGGGMDVSRQQLDEQKRANVHLSVIANALTTRNIGITPYGALA
jgi:hypothetical protein